MYPYLSSYSALMIVISMKVTRLMKQAILTGHSQLSSIQLLINTLPMFRLEYRGQTDRLSLHLVTLITLQDAIISPCFIVILSNLKYET